MPRYGVRQAGGQETLPVSPSAALQGMTMPAPPGGMGVPVDSVGTLATAGSAPLPHGSYGSPWYSGGCGGPFGMHGPVNYELYFNTGPVVPIGGTVLSRHLNTGWDVSGGGRSLFFNQVGDAAWIIDLGLSYQYNRGNVDLVNAFVRQPSSTNPITGASNEVPDVFGPVRIRGLHRTAFNFAFGRDWWLWGPGNAGFEQGWNLRVGAELGGRWGTAHVDMVPDNDPALYSRRQNVFNGVFLGGHADIEAPFGGWTWCAGLRLQYGMDWMNILPPQSSDIQYLNILITTGFKF